MSTTIKIGPAHQKALDLPKTHFETNDGWILVRSAGLGNLPKVDEEILFVSDVRGSSDEDIIKMLHPHKTITPRVCHGFVQEVGYYQETGDWWIAVHERPNNRGGAWSINGKPDYVTYWRYLIDPPVDTYHPSDIDRLHAFNIIQLASVELIQQENEFN